MKGSRLVVALHKANIPLSKLKAIVVFGVVVFLAVELTYRFYAFGVRSLHPLKMDSVQVLSRAGLITPSDHPEIVYELKPDLNTYFKLTRFRTNSAGLRDRKYPVEKPSNTFRVVVIGSSFTMGSGVDIEETYHSQLEERLNRERHGRRFEFINFAVGGYGPRMILATLERRALAYDPDLILYGLTVSTPRIVRVDEVYSKRYQVKPKGHAFFRSFVVCHLLRTCRKSDKKKLTPKLSMRRFEETLDQLEKIESEHRVPIIFAVLQHHWDNRVEAIRLAETVRRHGFTVIDTVLAFKQERSDLTIYRTENHPSPRAHAIFAQSIYHELTNNTLLRPRGL